jgi:hypothetical protein
MNESSLTVQLTASHTEYASTLNLRLMARDNTWTNKSRHYRHEAEKIASVSNIEDTSVEVIERRNVLGLNY